MQYRLYRPEDFAALYAIEEVCFEPPFRFSRSYMRQLVANRGTATWIAEQDAATAGFAIIDWARTPKGTVAYIQTLEVLLTHRGQGIGAELLRRLESSARAAEAHVIWLHVDEENAAAIRLYTAQGFVADGWEENYYPQGRAALVLVKTL